MISLQTIFNNMIFKIEHIDLDIAQLALQNSFLDNNSKDEGKQFIQIAEILKVPLTDSLQYNKI